MEILSGDHIISLTNNPLKKFKEEQPDYSLAYMIHLTLNV